MVYPDSFDDNRWNECGPGIHFFVERGEEEGWLTKEINGYDFVCTCDACPEQYDVYSNGKEVGYVRLRFGCLTADYNNAQVYYHRFKDDEYKGSFDTNAERDKFLTLIAKKLKFEERRRANNAEPWQYDPLAEKPREVE